MKISKNYIRTSGAVMAIIVLPLLALNVFYRTRYAFLSSAVEVNATKLEAMFRFTHTHNFLYIGSDDEFDFIEEQWQFPRLVPRQRYFKIRTGKIVVEKFLLNTKKPVLLRPPLRFHERVT